MYADYWVAWTVETPWQGVSTVFAMIAPKGRNTTDQGSAHILIHKS